MEKIILTSPAFRYGEIIPVKYSCDGEDVSPPLQWQKVPEQTKSLVLIMEDPDAPMGTWVHWVLYDISPTVTSLPENVPPIHSIDSIGVHGMTNFRRLGYGGPCPPSGTHRYFFRLYALDTMITAAPGANKDQLMKSMEGHLLGQGELMGLYKRE